VLIRASLSGARPLEGAGGRKARVRAIMSRQERSRIEAKKARVIPRLLKRGLPL